MLTACKLYNKSNVFIKLVNVKHIEGLLETKPMVDENDPHEYLMGNCQMPIN